MTNDAETLWVRSDDLRLGDVVQSRLGAAELIAQDAETPDLKLTWRAFTSGETFTSVVAEDEREHMMALVRRGDA